MLLNNLKVKLSWYDKATISDQLSTYYSFNPFYAIYMPNNKKYRRKMSLETLINKHTFYNVLYSLMTSLTLM